MAKKELPFCACGCGGRVKYYRKSRASKWIAGHCPNSLSNLTNRGLSEYAQQKAREAFAANPVMQKGPNHVNGRVWRIRSPMGVPYEFRNLREFVRNNPDLFDPGDVQWKPTKKGDLTCAAHRGIAMISDRCKNNRGSWKGWTLYSQTERIHNGGKCLVRNT